MIRPSPFRPRYPVRLLLGSLFVAVIVVVAAESTLAADAAPTSAFPFQIEAVGKRIGAGGFPNTTANPFAKTTVSVFRVRYRGAPVRIASGKTTIDEFWEARILVGAPLPAVLVAGTGAYLLVEQQGRLQVEVMAPATTDLARWQWLDGNNAQPDVEHNVTIRESAGESRNEHGGHLLLLNRQRVLDVDTLKSYPVAVNSSENVERMGGYNAGNEQARMLSPGRSQYVVVGDRNAGSGFEYALVAVDYANASLYAIPFDRNALRFESVWDATPEWIGHYFEWTRDARGAERLQLRKDVKPLPWLGRFVRFAGGMVDYTLYPTQPAMYDALLAFLRSDYGATDMPSPTGAGANAQAQTLMIEGSPLRLWYRPEEKTTMLFANVASNVPPQTAYALVEKIGLRFNESLRKGEHQQLFAEYLANR